MATNVVLFDGVCVLCNRWAQFIIKQDTKQSLTLASVQSPEGQAILTHYNMSTAHFDTLLYIENLSIDNITPRDINGLQLKSTKPTDNLLFIKTDAIFKILLQLGFPWYLSLIFKPIPRYLRDKLYLLIANNRYRLFGKTNHCLLPTPDHESRYLSATNHPPTK